MGEAAVAAARAIGYVGAGTVEFLLDRDGAFYFMEMNTRLQVEHPVTEFITGQDLVEWQLRVAAGEPLALTQGEIQARGHAIEARLYAEDPDRDFLPQTGRLHHLRFPEPGPCVRIDTGVRSGDAITVHYDPMIAKLIVRGRDRAAAVRRLQVALAATEVAGLTTNLRFLQAIARHPAFAAAELDTSFIERHHADLLPPPTAPAAHALALATLGLLLDRERRAEAQARRTADPWSPWASTRGWRLNETLVESFTFTAGGDELVVGASPLEPGWRLDLPDGAAVTAAGRLDADGRLAAVLGERRLAATWLRHGSEIDLFAGGEAQKLALVEPLAAAFAQEAAASRVQAPMPGKVTAILIEAGAAVSRGQPLLVLEAMKMEHTLKAPADGTVTALRCAVGELVEEGVELVGFEAAEPAP
jgi:3-methylcrotonyl-CoA carboxylase alpha subunit